VIRPNAAERRALRAALVVAAPWLEHSEAGPRAVDAGQCDRCHDHPRLLPTCGPGPWRALCRDCGLEIGTDGWCDGHAEDAAALLAWADDLPPWWGDAVVLWWLSTGEVETAPPSVTDRLPTPVLAALPPTARGLT